LFSFFLFFFSFFSLVFIACQVLNAVTPDNSASVIFAVGMPSETFWWWHHTHNPIPERDKLVPISMQIGANVSDCFAFTYPCQIISITAGFERETVSQFLH
jgi:hypothetical protein